MDSATVRDALGSQWRGVRGVPPMQSVVIPGAQVRRDDTKFEIHGKEGQAE